MSGITVLDGGLSRELVRFGAELRQPEWSAGALIERPDVVRKVHEAFFRAGAEIATTASYAVVPFHIGNERFTRDGLELAGRSGRLAREAADAVRDCRPGARVAGCLPPACGSYIPEKFTPAEAQEVLSVLVDGLNDHVDFWLAETMSSLQEMRITAAAAADTGKPLWLSCSLYDDDPDHHSLPPLLRSGEPVEEAAALAVELGAEVLLFNCSMPEVMEQAIIVALHVLAVLGRDIPVGVYANAFDRRATDGDANETLSDIRTDLDPSSYLDWADRWVVAGATLIGGCCGIGVDHIAALHARYRSAAEDGSTA